MFGIEIFKLASSVRVEVVEFVTITEIYLPESLIFKGYDNG
jgi:hypothetical protein